MSQQQLIPATWVKLPPSLVILTFHDFFIVYLVFEEHLIFEKDFIFFDSNWTLKEILNGKLHFLCNVLLKTMSNIFYGLKPKNFCYSSKDGCFLRLRNSSRSMIWNGSEVCCLLIVVTMLPKHVNMFKFWRNNEIRQFSQSEAYFRVFEIVHTSCLSTFNKTWFGIYQRTVF